MADATVIIVGGGVIGLSAAYHLASNNSFRIIVIEKERVGAGSSGRAAGITTGLLWSETGIRARQIGIEWFRRLSGELPDYKFHDDEGCLNLFTEAGWAERERLLPLYQTLGVEYDVLSAAQVRKRWPDLHPPDDFIAIHDPKGGYSEPHRYISGLVTRLRTLGVEFIEGLQVDDLIVTNSRVVGVKCAKEPLYADAVISGIHSWSALLWQQLGLVLPVKSFVHQRYLSLPRGVPFMAPAINADPYLGYMRPAENGRILLGVETPDRLQWDIHRRDFSMDELIVSDTVRDSAVERFRRLAPALQGLQWESKHIGLIAFTADGEPILGATSDWPGLFVAGGFHSGGFSYNTIAGILLAEMVGGRPTSVDITAFSPDRFRRDQSEQYLNTSVAQRDAVRRRH